MERQMILGVIAQAQLSGARLEPACAMLGLRAHTVQRWRGQGGGEDRRCGPKSEPPNKLSARERERVLQVVNSKPYCDLAPHQIVPLLADSGVYLSSESTIYRLLRQADLLAHRQRSKPAVRQRKTAHVASAPCQVFSWDITYLKSPVRGSFFYLYLILDIWSRKIMGAKVFAEESMEHASALFEQTCKQHHLDPQGIVLHADNGGPMKGSSMLATLQKLGVVASFSRPRVSDDNPYSEALFRTLKYRPEYPSRPFVSLEAANLWVEGFVRWYNHQHLHSGIRFLTPNARHEGRGPEILAQRHRVYQRARRKHPQRWSGATRNWNPIQTVYLNPEKPTEKISQLHAA
jgi:putative transposase